MKSGVSCLAGFIFITLSSFSHNPLTSRFELRASLDKGALLNVYLTQSGVHSALLKKHPSINFPELSSSDYKSLLFKYIKSKVVIFADGEKLNLRYGAIKLGKHQTDMKFFIDNYPNKVQRLEVNIDAFKENGKQYSVFLWYAENKSSKVILSHKNNFSVYIDLNQGS